MPRKKLTPANVRSFYTAMERKFKFQVVYTGDGSHLEELSDILECVGIPAGDFLGRFAFTVGDRVFMPWKPGGSGPSLTQQVCILVHEIIHVVHARGKGYFRWILLYARKKAYRAHCESKALRANLEMYYYLTGRKPSITPMLHSLTAYRLRSADIGTTHAKLNIVSSAMVRGKGSHRAIREAIKWWEV